MRRLFILAIVLLSLSCTRGVRMDEPRPYPGPGGRTPTVNECHEVSRSRCDGQCGSKSDLVTYQCRNGSKYTRCEVSDACK